LTFLKSIDQSAVQKLAIEHTQTLNTHGLKALLIYSNNLGLHGLRKVNLGTLCLWFRVAEVEQQLDRYEYRAPRYKTRNHNALLDDPY
jgi:hypothetical protein